MPVHSIHIFDRKGKTLFTKRYMKDDAANNMDDEELSEQRKLVFGMLFSLREVVTSLTPEDLRDSTGTGALQSVQTGASTLYNYETASGLRFAMYVTNFAAQSDTMATTTAPNSANALTPSGASSSASLAQNAYSSNIRNALAYIYNELWIQCVTRSPLYQTDDPNVHATNFEQNLDNYLATQSWFR